MQNVRARVSSQAGRFRRASALRHSSLAFFFILISIPVAAHPGVGIVMDTRGNVFYTDLKHVWKIAPDGTKSIAVPNVHTHELYLDAQGNLYGEHLWYEGQATDTWGHRVWRLGTDGNLVDIIPPREGFRQNYSFVRDLAGNMYWAERGPRTRIHKRSPDGAIRVHATAELRTVRWMACTADGTLFLIDDDDLIRIERDGSVHTVAKDLGERRLSQFYVGDHHVVMGLWPDTQGNVYVAVYGGRVVKKVGGDGRVSVFARSPIPWSPTGVSVAPNGDVWVLEYSITNAVRVRRFQSDGKVVGY